MFQKISEWVAGTANNVMAAPNETSFAEPETSMGDIAAFFNECRSGVMGPTLDNDEVAGASAVLKAMDGLPIAWVAYALATAWHETAHTMQPIKEYGGNRYFTRMYDIRGARPALARRYGNIHAGDGAKFCGRGYVQLTWRVNYEKADSICAQAGLTKVGALLNNPDLAMRPDIAAMVMRHGMRYGWFTSKAFQHYLPAKGLATRPQFNDARRIINGRDKQALIAGYAMQFQVALVAGDWRH